MKARDARLGDLLSEIGEASGVVFVFDGRMAERVDADFDATPLDQAIAGLLDSAGYSYASIDGAAGRRRLLLARRGAPAPRPSGAVAPTTPPAHDDDPLLREQRATDALFDACKAGACDSS